MTHMEFPALDPAERNRLLADPAGPVRVLIDTDAANEIDDQFALTWALLSPERLRVEALVAEPYSFAHLRPALRAATESLERDGTATSMVDDITSWARRLREQGLGPDDIDLVGPDEGMERSYQEILRVLDNLGRPPGDKVVRGAPGYLPAAGTPVDSPGARAIIETALASDDPLYVLAIGCLTNVASALLLEPEIARRMVVVWTSGYPTWAERSNRSSLNLVQDAAATRVVLDSGVPLVYLPGYYIGAQLRLSLPDMEAHVRGRGEIGDYLHHLYTHNPIHAQRGIDDLNARTWVIWDLITVAWVLEPGWVPTDLVPTPQLDEELRWRPRAGAPPMREAHGVDRDGIFRDLFRKLDGVSNAEHRPADRS